jgi:methyl-accepting chemotaxis protein
MTSIAYPVISGGKLVGVSGVDISLRSLSDKLTSLHPFGSGRVTLLSQSGAWIVAPKPELVMKAYDGEGADAVKGSLSSLATTGTNSLTGSSILSLCRISTPTGSSSWTFRTAPSTRRCRIRPT